jgi:hypothetical protein
VKEGTDFDTLRGRNGVRRDTMSARDKMSLAEGRTRDFVADKLSKETKD